MDARERYQDLGTFSDWCVSYILCHSRNYFYTSRRSVDTRVVLWPKEDTGEPRETAGGLYRIVRYRIGQVLL